MGDHEFPGDHQHEGDFGEEFAYADPQREQVLAWSDIKECLEDAENPTGVV